MVPLPLGCNIRDNRKVFGMSLEFWATIVPLLGLGIATFSAIHGMRSDLRGEILEVKSNLGERMDNLTDRMDRIEGEIGGLSRKIDALDTKIDRLDTRLDRTNSRIDILFLRSSGKASLEPELVSV